MVQKVAKMCTKMVSNGSEGPRGYQEGPRGYQNEPKLAQGGPKRVQGDTKMSQNGSIWGVWRVSGRVFFNQKFNFLNIELTLEPNAWFQNLSR